TIQMNSDFAIHLSHKSIFLITGKDKIEFLQNIISNDIRHVSKKQSIYSTLLSPQGKFLYDFNIIQSGEDFLIQCNKNDIDDLIARLTIYKLRSDVVFVKKDEELLSLFINVDSKGIFESSKKILGSTMVNEFGIFFNDTRISEFGIHGIIQKNKVEEFVKTLNLQTLPIQTYQKLCHNIGFFEFLSKDILNQIFSLELNLKELHGVDFKKGCFVGQENTARMNLKEKIRRRLLPVQILNGQPKEQETIKLNDKIIGKIVSTDPHCFALIKIEEEELLFKQSINLDNASIKIIKPYWLNI
ncbi:MAG: folate-binding protein, partial [Proteobacteria bacterium]|nr:folate-binding protein [Pseudomonadota bacterium]